MHWKAKKKDNKEVRMVWKVSWLIEVVPSPLCADVFSDGWSLLRVCVFVVACLAPFVSFQQVLSITMYM